MTNRIQIREMLAWTVLVLAILIFSFSVSFAQGARVEVTEKNGALEWEILRRAKNGNVSKEST